MKVFKKHFFPAFFLLLLLNFSCIKARLRCTGNCAEVTFAGRIYDKPTNSPIANQEVNVSLYKNTSCWLCLSRKIGSVRSGKDGRFSFVANIDTTLLKENHIMISVKTPANYISYAQSVGPGMSHDPIYANEEFSKLDSPKMGNLLFGFYSKVLLTVNLHRISPIYPQSRHLSLNFVFDNKTFGWGLNERSSNADTSLTINTAANKYTKIICRKFIAANTIISKIDSVYCKPNVNNVISITY